jgi:hypothetical protein
MPNYRTVSLLTSFSKIFEKLIYVRIYEHLVGNNISVDEQYVFRINSSTVIATHKVLNAVLNQLNNKKIFDGIFCALHKAFDCVNHKILLAKLEVYGITGKFLNLINSYLGDRYHKVSLRSSIHSDNISSDLRKITHDVPPESILGPLLFLYTLMICLKY